MKICGISDIHGDLTTFKKLLNKCEYNEEEDYLIILGDFLEKGTEILDTVHYVMELSKKEDEGTLTEEERSDLDFLERQAEWEMYEDLRYQW